MDENLIKLIKDCIAIPDGNPLTPEQAEGLTAALAQYPFSPLFPLLLLRHGGSVELRNTLALNTSCPRTMAFAKYGSEWANFYPEAELPQAKETVDVIDTFLRTYGSCTPEEEKLLEKMIFNPTPDYAEMLARQEQDSLPPEDGDAEAGSDDALINAFIRSHHPAAHRPDLMPLAQEKESVPVAEKKVPVAKPEHSDDSLLSESLAKIFIKQGRYEKAYEIISSLNLKFPKKSAYFADQLRFLQKLIINRRQIQENAQGAAPQNTNI